MNDHEEPGYLARQASRATQPATGLRPRTAGMFEGGTSASLDTFGDAVGRWTPAPQPEHSGAADVEGRDPGLRAAVQAKVEAKPRAADGQFPAGVDFPAEVPVEVTTGSPDATLLAHAAAAALVPYPPSLSATDLPVTGARDVAAAPPVVAVMTPAGLRTPSSENSFHQMPRQKASDAAKADFLPRDTRGSAPGRHGVGPPPHHQASSPADDLHATGLQPHRGEPTRRQIPLPPPDPPGMPRLHPSKPEPDAPPARVTVTIGRIEVLAPAPDKPPRKPPRPRARPATAPQLGDYLRQRRDGG